MRLLAWLAALFVAVLVVGCGSQHEGPGPVGSPPASVASSATPSLATLAQPGDRCGFPDRRAKLLRFPATDGTVLDGAIVGEGLAGVVLANQSNSSLCGWWPFADHLATNGYRVLVFDFRCTALSACPDGDARGDYPSDLEGAAAALRADGAATVALVGASLGANVAMIAGATIRPRVSTVISLSGPPDLTGLIDERLDAYATAPKLTSPLLQMVAREDTVAFVPDIRRMARAAGSKVSEVMILDASYGHGWDMVSNAVGEPTDVAHVVLDFLTAHD